MWKGTGLIVLILAATPAGAGGQSAVKQLEPELIELLRHEMRAIEGAMGELPGHLARGDWQRVEVIGRNIHNSFILKQEMAPKQKKALKETLPEAFREMDRQFHRQAATLAEQARDRDVHGAIDTYRDMLSGCVNCHRQFAPGRFPGLEQPR